MCSRCGNEHTGNSFYCKLCVAIFNKEQYEKNKVIRCEYQKKYHQDHKDDLNLKRRILYHSNKDIFRERHSRWRKNNPDVKNVSRMKYKARKLNAAGTYTVEAWQKLCSFYNNKCLRCGSSEKLTVDHVIPLALGGTNDIGNIQPLCLSCNCSKRHETRDYRFVEVYCG